MPPSSTDVEVIAPAQEEALSKDDIEESGAVIKNDVDIDKGEEEDPFADHENLPQSPFKDRPHAWHSTLEQSVCEYLYSSVYHMHIYNICNTLCIYVLIRNMVHILYVAHDIMYVRCLSTIIISNSDYYAPNPLMFSVIFLLTLMVLDRTVMWGTTYTNVPFLTGFYNNSWNPNMGASQAAMFSSSAMIVAVSY